MGLVAPHIWAAGAALSPPSTVAVLLRSAASVFNGHKGVVRCLVVFFILLVAAPADAAPQGRVSAVTAGWAHTCALRVDDRVACWGRGHSGVPVRVPGLARVTQLAAGGDATCAVRRGGRVLCWRGGGGARAVAGITDARQVAVGPFFRCVLRTGGGVLCWGDNDAGALGNGGTADSATPVPVSGVAGAVQVAAAGGRACVVDASARRHVLGRRAARPGRRARRRRRDRGRRRRRLRVRAALGRPRGLLGQGRRGDDVDLQRRRPDADVACRAPADVPGVAGAVGLAAGGNAGCAVGRGGHVACWGDNAYGTLGDGTRLPSTGAVIVERLADARRIAVGAAHACAVRANGAAVCWGRGDEGVLGDGRRTARNAPVAVKGIG